MENASKALLIAGAILICILLIAVAMYIYSSARTTIDTAASKMSSQEKDIYNSAVSSYLGDSKKGSQVRAMIDAVKNSNASNTGETGKFIGIYLDSIAGATKPTEQPTANEDGKIVAYKVYETDNTNEKVNEASDLMDTIKAKINTNKNYDIKADYTDGVITMLYILASK